MGKKLLVGLVLVILGFLLLVLMQPSDFSVHREVPIKASPDQIFPHINDLKKFNAWNPWNKMDPSVSGTYTGPELGMGSSYSWVGEKVGVGTMTIVESEPHQLVKMRLDFTKPMVSTDTAEFTLTPSGDETIVAWNMNGKNNIVSKAMNVFMRMDKMLGGTFELGLADLKSIVESTPPAQ
jgi:uncharacterized protein YndB with AHSA1/START domain